MNKKEILPHKNRLPLACQICFRALMKGGLAYHCLIKPIKLRHYATGWKVCEVCGTLEINKGESN